MEDKDIIKALERCGQHRECCYCNSVEECGSKRVLTASALDLINRQKTEIERLKAESQMADGYADALVERTKSEAIKEFAERLKSYLLLNGSSLSVVSADNIDHIVAEMTEGRENG